MFRAIAKIGYADDRSFLQAFPKILLTRSGISMNVATEQIAEVRVDSDLIRFGVIPRHIAIIMDGNRRWAGSKGVSPFLGHWKGAEVITDIVRFASEIGVKIITLYSFSTENWSRSSGEIEHLMEIFSWFLREKIPFMLQESVRLMTIGDCSRLPDFVKDRLETAKEATRNGSKITLVLALNYGSRDEIRRAFLRMTEDLEAGKIVKKDVTESLISGYLDTAELGDPDLFIRTGGEQRLSNFLLWQLSYTEVYIAKPLWPDFTRKDLLDAVGEFQKRHRRLGGG